MAYDDFQGEVVMFGGNTIPDYLKDTWTWDGSNWTQRFPTNKPSARAGAGMAYDAATQKVVLFGGDDGSDTAGDTWTWDGRNWTVPFLARLRLSPNAGPPGSAVQVRGTGFAAFEGVTLTFIDPVAGESVLGTFTTDGAGTLNAQVTILLTATVGPKRITAGGTVSHQKAKARFTVT